MDFSSFSKRYSSVQGHHKICFLSNAMMAMYSAFRKYLDPISFFNFFILQPDTTDITIFFLLINLHLVHTVTFEVKYTACRAQR